ncbi:HEAT repeat domain-containing protein [Arenibaculum sp.]|jgi:HEAT repeat protein|uniref:HEAT repeat domain-containing protein n=1 Tax=Arenibaculum sp. TaxID=2865862 RepID=UPI002E0F2AB4|nr:HEAT repeat domain-containing protein [Arenibaculum sp.]
MPLVRREPGKPQPDAGTEAADLRSADPERRRRAVRGLGRALDRNPEAAETLTGLLATEPDPTVREAILSSLVGHHDPRTAQALLPLLRSQDAGLRNGASEALQAMPDAVRPHLPGLLADDDPDVRILAADLARGLPAREASALLCDMLDRETHVNACAAAIDVLAETGTPDALGTLRAVAGRFPGEPFLAFAVSVAIARIEGSGG